MARLRDYQWNQWVLDYTAASADPFTVMVGDAIGKALATRAHHIGPASTRAQFMAFCRGQGITRAEAIAAAHALYSALEVAKNARRRAAVATRIAFAKERALRRAAKEAARQVAVGADGTRRAAAFTSGMLLRRVGV